jgi:hypothetical protein
MAPKSKAKAKPAAKSLSTKKPSVKADIRQREGRRDLDKQVQRLMQEKLGDVEPWRLTSHIVSGSSLTAKVTKDKEQALSEKRNLSHVYWQRIRVEFNIPEQHGELQVLNKDEEVCPDLSNGLREARNPNAGQRSKACLCSWLRTATAINQRSLVGLLRFAVSVKPTTDTAVLFHLDVMRFIVRLDLTRLFKKDILSIQSCVCIHMYIHTYTSMYLCTLYTWKIQIYYYYYYYYNPYYFSYYHDYYYYCLHKYYH